MTIQSNVIATIIDSEWPRIKNRCNSYQIRILHGIRSCRSSRLGGELYQCNKCNKHHVRYNSCRNRHCPQCQNTQKLRWISDRSSQVIETKYYHVVFTLPDKLNELCLGNQRVMYASLFRSTWETLEGFGWNKKYLGAQLGATMVLHTWGSNLSFHPHVHCIVPGGGVNFNNKWKTVKGGGKYLFPVKELSRVFRSKYLAEIKKSGIIISEHLSKALFKNSWVVYAKPAFGNADVLIKYLARYAYKTAITHHRIKSYDTERVSFSYKDYRHGNVQKVMSLSTWEFVRRFTMHLLPKGFCRIRHYGILNASWKKEIFLEKNIVPKKNWKQIWEERGLDLDRCKECKNGKLEYVCDLLPKRGPPK